MSASYREALALAFLDSGGTDHSLTEAMREDRIREEGEARWNAYWAHVHHRHTPGYVAPWVIPTTPYLEGDVRNKHYR